MKKIAFALALLAGVVLAIPAHAQEPGKSYLGLGYGANWTDGALYPGSPPGVEADGVAAGFKIYGGNMWSNWGMELGYHDLGKYDIQLLGAKVAESHTTAFSVSGIYAGPLTPAVSFFAKLGIAFTQHDLDCPAACATTGNRKRGLSGLLGLGATAKISQDTAVRVELEHFGAVHHAFGFVEYKSAYDTFSTNIQFSF